MTTIYKIVLRYQGCTKIWKSGVVWLECADLTDAKLKALAFFHIEYPELKRSAVRVSGWVSLEGGFANVNTGVEQKRLVEERKPDLKPFDSRFGWWRTQMPYFVEDKPLTHWMYDPKAKHKGRNRRGKFVPITPKTKIKRRFTDDGEPASE